MTMFKAVGIIIAILVVVATIMLWNTADASCAGTSRAFGNNYHEADIRCPVAHGQIDYMRMMTTDKRDRDRDVKFYTTSPYFDVRNDIQGKTNRNDNRHCKDDTCESQIYTHGRGKYICRNTNSYLLGTNHPNLKYLIAKWGMAGDELFECRVVSQRPFQWNITSSGWIWELLQYIQIEYDLEASQPANFHKMPVNR